MIQQFKDYNDVHHLIHKGDAGLIGVSGGADSVCLLHLLDSLKREWRLSLHVLHVNHGIRGEAADRDARFVEKLAEERGLDFRLVSISVPEEAQRLGMTEEETGRFFRYKAFEEYREQHKLDWIAVAHHQDDQAETFLFRLFRGTGPRGLAGIPAQREHIIRPLLFAGRQEIEGYLRQEGLAWCQDATNEETVYTRNCIRHEILPLIEEKINPKAGLHIAQAAEKMSQWRDFVERQGRQLYEQTAVFCEGKVILPVDRLVSEDLVLQQEVLRLALMELIPGAKDVGQSHFDKMTEFLQAEKVETGKILCLPGGITMEKQYGELVFSAEWEKSNETMELVCQIPSRHIVKWKGEQFEISLTVAERMDLEERIPEKDYTKLFDYDMIKGSLVLRSPKEGDFFIIDEEGHRKKLNRHYIDRKIPRSRRQEQLVLAEGAHVLWAFPDRMSEAYKIKQDTKKILIVTKERKRS